MRSGWFWGTSEWERYQGAYWAGRMRPEEYKSSPLANDHDFKELEEGVCFLGKWDVQDHQTQVIDLRLHQWTDLRKSYHSIIHRALERYTISPRMTINPFREVHARAFGLVRSPETFQIQNSWIEHGCAEVVVAHDENENPVAAAFWIIWKDGAYYASGPSLVQNLQHAVIWESLVLMKSRGITLVDMGQIDGETEKEKNIGKFKAGFGGSSMSYTVVRRIG